MMEDNLKPCPFCGSIKVSATFTINKKDEISCRMIECESCAAFGPACKESPDLTLNEMTNKTIRAWNTRHIFKGKS